MKRRLYLRIIERAINCDSGFLPVWHRIPLTTRNSRHAAFDRYRVLERHPAGKARSHRRRRF
ncbi:protein of unknown function [Pseudomonas sp. JV551A1]|nr:protein of unknown function [Pseudomonas sp. JV551A1]